MPRINSYNNEYILNTDGFTIATPLWLTADEMNQSIGLHIDPQQYQAGLDAASRAKGVANRGAWQQVANQAYSQMRANQNSALNAMRSMQARSILNGSAKGIAAATQMLATLGMNQQNTEQMTQLRQAQAQTYLDTNAEVAANYGVAIEYTDKNRQYLGDLAGNRYATDMNAASSAASTAGQIIAAREQAAAARYAADRYADAMVQAARASAGGGGGYSGGVASPVVNVATQPANLGGHGTTAASAEAAARAAAAFSAGMKAGNDVKQSGSTAATAAKAAQP